MAVSVNRPRFGVLAAVAWWLLVTVILFEALQLLVRVSPKALYDPISLMLVLVLVLGVGCYGLTYVYRREALLPQAQPPVSLQHAGTSPAGYRLADFFALGPVRLAALMIGLGLGLAIKFPADALRTVVEAHWPTPDEQVALLAEQLRHESGWQMVALLVSIGLLGPIIEELFYRGVLYRLLEEARGKWIAWLTVTVCFVLAHANIRDWPSLLLVSAALTYARTASGSLWPSLAGHVMFNSATLLALFAGFSELDAGEQLPAWMILLGIGGTLALLWVTRRASFTIRGERE